VNRFHFSRQSSESDELLGGRYRLIEKLGSGGFGQTFLAQDLHLPGNPQCVIKRLQPQIKDAASLQTAKRLFDTEVEVLYKLGNHDQIPRLLAHFEHQQEFYLAQELVVGQTLIPELMEAKPWTEEQTIAFLRDLLGVLDFVHQQNVIHRDIKPANLIRRERDRKIVLIDFGAVKQVTTSLTYANGVSQTIAIGTHGYMPSEQIAGTPRFSSDIYATGMVAIQMLTGASPQSLSLDPQTNEIEWQDLALQVSPALMAVLDRMIRYDFRARYPSAAAALTAIEQLSEQLSDDAAFGETAFPVRRSEPPPSLNEPTTVPWKNSEGKNISLPPPVSEPTSESIPEPTSESIPEPTSELTPDSLSQTTTRPIQAFRKPIDSTTAKPTVWLSTLIQLRQLQPRRLVLPLVGIAALATVIKMVSSPQPIVPSLAQSPASPSVVPSAVSLPSPSPNPVAQASTLLPQANRLREQKRFQPAIDRYQQVIALNPKLSEAHWGSCYSLNALEKFTQAIAACDAALKIKPAYAEALWSKGYALDRQQQDQQALELYEQAIALKPDFAEAWSNKGTALLQLNQPTKAIAAFDQATRLQPNFAEAWNNRGAAL
jgi:eukaryotic-like serine/threonine-protein kinase